MRALGLLCLAALLAHVPTASPAALADSSLGTDDNWSAEFCTPGPSGRYSEHTIALIEYRGDLIAAGSFEYLDGAPAAGAAKWDGRHWEALGAETDLFDGVLYELLVYRDTLLGGTFLGRADTTGSCLLGWNGDAWLPYAGGLNGTTTELKTVGAMIIHEGDLVVAGRFSSAGGVPVKSIARWDGQQWSPIGDLQLAGEYSSYRALASYRGDLYAGGEFTLAPADSFGRLIRWSGSAWELAGGGTDGRVNCLLPYGDRLLVGGNFTRAGSTSVEGIAVFDGVSFEPLGDPPIRNEWGTASVGLLSEVGDDLFVSGFFDSAGTAEVRNLARWNGYSWAATHEVEDDVSRLDARSMIAWNGRIIAAGSLQFSGVRQPLAAIHEGRWQPFDTTRAQLVDEPVTLLSADEGLYASAGFRAAKTMRSAHSVARWRDAKWEILGGSFNLAPEALAIHGGTLVAGGGFRFAGDDTVGPVVEWTGDRWSSLGSELRGRVATLDSFGGELVAGGRIYSDTDRFLRGVARWNGTSWSGLYDEDPEFGVHEVTDLCHYDGELYATGAFRPDPSPPEFRLASWNGRRWRLCGRLEDLGPLGWPLEQVVSWNGQLVVRGWFEEVAGDSAEGLAVWDGLRFRPVLPLVGSFLGGRLCRIESYQGRVVVGGNFEPPELRDTYVLQWDGTQWYRMGAGVWSGGGGIALPAVTSIATDGDDLYLGGRFHAAGQHRSEMVARWHGPELAVRTLGRSLRIAPNPASGNVTVQWYLPTPGTVRLRLFDVRGRELNAAAPTLEAGGPGSRSWRTADRTGRPLPSGVYFVTLESRAGTASGKMVVLR